MRTKLYAEALDYMVRPVSEKIGGSDDDPYMARWFTNIKGRWLTKYFHLFLHSDDDRALHDHPAASVSILLSGNYIEHFMGGRSKRRTVGGVYFRRAATAHRIELENDEDGQPKKVVTLFFMFRRCREWGFWCPQGWRHWREYTDRRAGSSMVGRGCD